MRATLVFVAILSLTAIALPQQPEPGQGRGQGRQFRDMDRVMGTVVSVSGDSLTIKPETGDNVTVKVSSDTRIRKNREEAKLADLKAGDHVFAAGKLGSDKVLAASLVGVGEMRGGAGMVMMGPGGTPPTPEQLQKMGLGTTFIAGEVKSIEDTKLTILRPDGQTQTIEVDESTSFRAGRGENSITLADIKVGDRVMGRGEVKNGVFVPQTLRVGGGMMMQHGGPEGGHPQPPPEAQPK